MKTMIAMLGVLVGCGGAVSTSTESSVSDETITVSEPDGGRTLTVSEPDGGTDVEYRALPPPPQRIPWQPPPEQPHALKSPANPSIQWHPGE
jgi:hypothetical protein